MQITREPHNPSVSGPNTPGALAPGPHWRHWSGPSPGCQHTSRPTTRGPRGHHGPSGPRPPSPTASPRPITRPAGPLGARSSRRGGPRLAHARPGGLPLLAPRPLLASQAPTGCSSPHAAARHTPRPSPAGSYVWINGTPPYTTPPAPGCQARTSHWEPRRARAPVSPHRLRYTPTGAIAMRSQPAGWAASR